MRSKAGDMRNTLTYSDVQLKSIQFSDWLNPECLGHLRSQYVLKSEIWGGTGNFLKDFAGVIDPPLLSTREPFAMGSFCVLDDGQEENKRPRKRDLVFKFLVIGDYGVGKTAIVRRFTDGEFSSNYKITIGADFSVKTIQWDANTRLSLQLWDVAGHERFGYITRIYYKNAIGCLVVFDLTRYSSFQSVDRWINDLNDKVALDNGSQLPTILLANKADIGENCVSKEVISRFCNERRLRAWFSTSAKTNLNIDEAIHCLIDTAIDLTKPLETPRPIRDHATAIQLGRSQTKNSACCTT